MNLGFEGYPYTWRNRWEEGFIQKMIDRALATNEWVQGYQQAVVKNVVLEGSDHAMLVLSTKVDQPKRNKRFMYDPRWNQRDQCNEVVQSCRGNMLSGVPGNILVANLKRVHHGLVMWRKKAGRNEHKEILCLKEILCHEYQKPGFNDQGIWDLETDLTQAIRKEEIYWCT